MLHNESKQYLQVDARDLSATAVLLLTTPVNKWIEQD